MVKSSGGMCAGKLLFTWAVYTAMVAMLAGFVDAAGLPGWVAWALALGLGALWIAKTAAL